MCLPLGFLKTWVGTSAFIVLALGIAMIVLDVLYVNNLKNDYIYQFGILEQRVP